MEYIMNKKLILGSLAAILIIGVCSTGIARRRKGCGYGRRQSVLKLGSANGPRDGRGCGPRDGRGQNPHCPKKKQ